MDSTQYKIHLSRWALLNSRPSAPLPAHCHPRRSPETADGDLCPVESLVQAVAGAKATRERANIQYLILASSLQPSLLCLSGLQDASFAPLFFVKVAPFIFIYSCPPCALLEGRWPLVRAVPACQRRREVSFSFYSSVEGIQTGDCG